MTAGGLSRTLETPQLVAYYVSSLVGVGILATPLLAARIAGPASLVAWGLLLLVSHPFAHVFARISITHPHSGGIASFVKVVLGSRVGHVVGLILVAAMVVLTTVMGIVTAQYLQVLLGFSSTSALVPIGFASTVLSVVLNLIGLRLGSRVQGVALLALIASVLAVLILAAPHAHPGKLIPFAPAGWTGVGSAAVICFFAFLGWENVATLAEEVRDPEQAFARAIRWAMAIVGVLYLALAAITVLVLERKSGSPDATVLSALLRVGGGQHAARVGEAVAVGILIIAANAWVLGCSRLIYTLAREGVLPQRLSRLSGPAATPCQALVALAVGCATIGGLVAVTDLGTRELITFVDANFLLVYLVCFIAVLKHFDSGPTRRLACTALASTTVFLPFLGSSLLYAVALAALAFVGVCTLNRDH